MQSRILPFQARFRFIAVPEKAWRPAMRDRRELFRPIRLDLPEIPEPRFPAVLRSIGAPEEVIGRDRVVANSRDERVRAGAVRLHDETIAAVAPRCAGRPGRALLRGCPGDLPGLPRLVVH